MPEAVVRRLTLLPLLFSLYPVALVEEDQGLGRGSQGPIREGTLLWHADYVDNYRLQALVEALSCYYTQPGVCVQETRFDSSFNLRQQLAWEAKDIMEIVEIDS